MSSPATSLRQLLVPHAHHWLENESGREHGGAPEPQPQRVEGEGVEGRDAEAEDGGECRDEGVEGGEEEMEGGGGGQQQERDGECEGGHHQLFHGAGKGVRPLLEGVPSPAPAPSPSMRHQLRSGSTVVEHSHEEAPERSHRLQLLLVHQRQPPVQDPHLPGGDHQAVQHHPQASCPSDHGCHRPQQLEGEAEVGRERCPQSPPALYALPGQRASRVRQLRVQFESEWFVQEQHHAAAQNLLQLHGCAEREGGAQEAAAESDAKGSVGQEGHPGGVGSETGGMEALDAAC